MLFRAIVETIAPERLQSLEVVTLAGDTVPDELVKLIADTCPELDIAIEYGVTEVAVMSTIQRRQSYESAVSIGKPVWNTQCYVVDRHLQLLPPGSVGELCIAGAGVARGYLGDPELTRDAFVPNFRGSGGFVYRTGDLVRYLSDGRLQFLGRRDHQVKIRGFRIETAEIENQLLGHPSVKEAVVTVATYKHRRELAAYVVARTEGSFDLIVVREYLSERLPGYMLPEHIIPLEVLPQTPNGKVDRRALPKPRQEGAVTAVPPETNLQRELAEIWSGVLAVDPHIR